MEYTLMERFTIICAHCRGAGCGVCRGGDVPIYVLETGAIRRRCRKHGHKFIGDPGHVSNEGELPRVCWCQRCQWRRIQTDVPEAYPIVA